MAETVLTLFRRNALKFGERPCFHYKIGEQWHTLSWVDAEERVRRYTLGLMQWNIGAGKTVAIWGPTCMEWTLLDLSILASGAMVVPIYPSLIKDQVLHILKDAKISLLFVHSQAMLALLEGEAEKQGIRIVLFDQAPKLLMEAGRQVVVNRYDEQVNNLRLSDTATIIYTSGTTGPPKGALLTHRNIMTEVTALVQNFNFDANSIGLLVLPLAHVMARAMQFFQLVNGCQAAYAESLEKLGQNFLEIRPHFFLGVPRLFEKIQEGVLLKMDKAPKPLITLLKNSLAVGLEVSELLQKHLPIPFGLRCQYALARVLLFSKLRRKMGGRIRYLISGGAPLQKGVAQFFHAAGIILLEGYGLTETFAAVSLNREDDFRLGSVGKPLEGMRIKLSDDGEICVKGDNIFQGYLGHKTETEEAFDSEGWFLTGDIGEFTKDGFLKITDRKKDIIATSGGKKIAPQNIERLLASNRYISQVMVYGDGQKFLSALVTLQWETVENYAKERGLVFQARNDLVRQPEIVQLIQKEIDACNQNLASFETIKKFAILDHDFSIESGELTPTMKVKRKSVTEKYRQVLESFYKEA